MNSISAVTIFDKADLRHIPEKEMEKIALKRLSQLMADEFAKRMQLKKVTDDKIIRYYGTITFND